MSFRGMWRWDDYSDSQNCMVTKGTCLSQCCYRDVTLRHRSEYHNFRCPDLGKKKKEKAALQKIQRSTSRQVEHFMLSRPWAHLVGVYLEFIRELKLSVRMRGATVKQQMCVRSSLMRKTRENNSQCECGRHLHSGSIIRPELTAEEMRSLQIIHLVIGQKNKTLHTLFLQLLNSSTEVFNSWLDDWLCDSYR